MSNIVFNSGAGAVGKTSVVTKTLELAPKYGRSVVSLPSVTRSVYSKLGIPTEKQATEMTFEQQWTLQMAIQDAYYQAIRNFIADNKTADIVMIDRSPLDHVAYLFHNLAFKIGLRDCLAQMDRAWNFLAEVIAMPEVDDVWIIHYPFPGHWQMPKENEQENVENASSDGFRFDAGGKNMLWSLNLEALLARTEREVEKRWPEIESFKELKITGWGAECATIEDRAHHILMEIV